MQEVFKEICLLLDIIEQVNNELLELLDDECSQSEALNYITDVQRTKCDTQSQLISFISKSSQVNSGGDSCNILIKKVDPPIFNGDVRVSNLC